MKRDDKVGEAGCETKQEEEESSIGLYIEVQFSETLDDASLTFVQFCINMIDAGFMMFEPYLFLTVCEDQNMVDAQIEQIRGFRHEGLVISWEAINDTEVTASGMITEAA